MTPEGEAMQPTVLSEGTLNQELVESFARALRRIGLPFSDMEDWELREWAERELIARREQLRDVKSRGGEKK